ncbi:hypothetical protein CFIO01_09813 [Colletotrichum fioriniae PJ7]|uniref:Uncharacterized protein n=1 Tax=Colletotrichum fioriniae PJ7 TaxID=1445577 RepID=A0A010RV62_9PEZI|nr:hypothetical protein CFIO01_09813 [Colletotrichum fioriniae PJ7]
MVRVVSDSIQHSWRKRKAGEGVWIIPVARLTVCFAFFAPKPPVYRPAPPSRIRMTLGESLLPPQFSPISIRVPPTCYSKTLSRRSTTPLDEQEQPDLASTNLTKRNTAHAIQHAAFPSTATQQPPEVAFTLSFPPGLLLLPSLSPVFSCPPKISRRPACDPSHIPHTQAFLEHFLPTTSTSTRFINNSIVTFGYFGLRLEELGTLTIASNQLLNPLTTVCPTWERLDSYPRFSPPPSARPSPGTRVVRRQQLDAYVNRHCESTDDCEAYSMASVRE